MVDRVEHIESESGEYLVVSRSTEVDSLAQLAYALGKLGLKCGVTVLIFELDGPSSSLKIGEALVESVDQFVGFAGFEIAGLCKPERVPF